MKLRKLLIPGTVLTLIGGTAKLCDTILNVNGDGFFLSTDVCNIITAVSFLLLFVLAFALSLADRKKTFSAEPRKNTVCGVFGFLASVLIIGGSVIQLLSFDTASPVENVLGIAGGCMLLYEACISFTGSNGMKKVPVAALLLPIWACVRFVNLFSQYTQVSLRATELFDIVEVAFMILFLFYQAMFFAGINNKVAVRRSTVYGSVFIMLSLIVTADLFIKMFTGPHTITNIDTQIVSSSINNIMTFAGDFALAVYAFFFLWEILGTAQQSELAAEKAEDDDQTILLTDEDLNTAAGNDSKAPTDILFSVENTGSSEPAAEKEEEPASESDKTSGQDTPSDDAPKAEEKSEEKSEPIKSEPVKDEPVKAETVKTEPVKTEPVKTESVKTEPAKTESVKTEPVKTESLKTEPVQDEPVKTEPVKTEKKPVRKESRPAQKPVLAEEERLPKVAEPSKTDIGGGTGGYDELLDMLDKMGS